MKTAFFKNLQKLAERHDDVHLVLGDLGFGAYEKFRDAFPSRVLNVGVAEQNMMGVAAGLASLGLRPFIYSIANFPLLRALEQFRNDVLKHELPVTVVSVGAGLDYGTLGYSHFGIEDIGVARSLELSDIYSPGDEIELSSTMEEIYSRKRPAYLRISKNDEENFHPEPLRRFDSVIQVRFGRDVALISSGSIVRSTLKAAERLEKMGVSCSVFSVPRLSTPNLSFLSKFSKAITIEEHVLTGGLGSLVAEHIVDRGLQIRLSRIGLSANSVTGVIGDPSFLREASRLSPEALTQQVLDLI